MHWQLGLLDLNVRDSRQIFWFKDSKSDLLVCRFRLWICHQWRNSEVLPLPRYAIFKSVKEYTGLLWSNASVVWPAQDSRNCSHLIWKCHLTTATKELVKTLRHALPTNACNLACILYRLLMFLLWSLLVSCDGMSLKSMCNYRYYIVITCCDELDYLFPASC